MAEAATPGTDEVLGYIEILDNVNSENVSLKFEVRKPETKIGRDENMDIRIHDSLKISRHHCSVVIKDDDAKPRAFLTNKSTRSTTTINGEKLQEGEFIRLEHSQAFLIPSRVLRWTYLNGLDHVPVKILNASKDRVMKEIVKSTPVQSSRIDSTKVDQRVMNSDNEKKAEGVSESSEPMSSIRGRIKKIPGVAEGNQNHAQEAEATTEEESEEPSDDNKTNLSRKEVKGGKNFTMDISAEGSEAVSDDTENNLKDQELMSDTHSSQQSSSASTGNTEDEMPSVTSKSTIRRGRGRQETQLGAEEVPERLEVLPSRRGRGQVQKIRKVIESSESSSAEENTTEEAAVSKKVGEGASASVTSEQSKEISGGIVRGKRIRDNEESEDTAENVSIDSNDKLEQEIPVQFKRTRGKKAELDVTENISDEQESPANPLRRFRKIVEETLVTGSQDDEAPTGASKLGKRGRGKNESTEAKEPVSNKRAPRKKAHDTDKHTSEDTPVEVDDTEVKGKRAKIVSKVSADVKKHVPSRGNRGGKKGRQEEESVVDETEIVAPEAGVHKDLPKAVKRGRGKKEESPRDASEPEDPITSGNSPGESLIETSNVQPPRRGRGKKETPISTEDVAKILPIRRGRGIRGVKKAQEIAELSSAEEIEVPSATVTAEQLKKEMGGGIARGKRVRGNKESEDSDTVASFPNDKLQKDASMPAKRTRGTKTESVVTKNDSGEQETPGNPLRRFRKIEETSVMGSQDDEAPTGASKSGKRGRGKIESTEAKEPVSNKRAQRKKAHDTDEQSSEDTPVEVDDTEVKGKRAKIVSKVSADVKKHVPTRGNRGGKKGRQEEESIVDETEIVAPEAGVHKDLPKAVKRGRGKRAKSVDSEGVQAKAESVPDASEPEEPITSGNTTGESLIETSHVQPPRRGRGKKETPISTEGVVEKEEPVSRRRGRGKKAAEFVEPLNKDEIQTEQSLPSKRVKVQAKSVKTDESEDKKEISTRGKRGKNNQKREEDVSTVPVNDAEEEAPETMKRGRKPGPASKTNQNPASDAEDEAPETIKRGRKPGPGSKTNQNPASDAEDEAPETMKRGRKPGPGSKTNQNPASDAEDEAPETMKRGRKPGPASKTVRTAKKGNRTAAKEESQPQPASSNSRATRSRKAV